MKGDNGRERDADQEGGQMGMGVGVGGLIGWEAGKGGVI